MKFWLIQRGKWNPYNKTKEEIKGLMGREGLIDLDYMGSAEFEWGAIPKAYRRIMAQFNQYELIELNLTNSNGVPLNLFCHKERVQETIGAIYTFLENPYQLKEYSSLDEAINPPKRFDNGKVFLPNRTGFWWEIENGIDFMCFIGVQDRRDLFMYAINNDYNNWWIKKTEEEREKDIAEAFNGR